MNIDANVQKILFLILRKWKLVVVIGLIGVMLAYFYTANFVTLTYTSSIEFLAYTQDTNQELSDTTTGQTVSNTSKMNYAIKMLNTYIELFKTTEFNQMVADELTQQNGQKYTAGQIKSAVTIETVEDTAMFKIYVNTTDKEFSYQIAKQLEKSIPEKMMNTNNGLVNASVEDPARMAETYESLGYVKKCVLGFMAGAIIAIAIVILRELLDVRIKSGEELTERYGIPVLGIIPEFEIKGGAIDTSKKAEAKEA